MEAMNEISINKTQLKYFKDKSLKQLNEEKVITKHKKDLEKRVVKFNETLSKQVVMRKRMEDA